MMTKERPILFGAPMVRAIFSGAKSQTRRAVKPQPRHVQRGVPYGAADPHGMGEGGVPIVCPYGKPGDRLWVRESWAAPHQYDGHQPAHIPALTRWHYAATEDRGGLRWRPSIHMPRAASRITLEIADVRVERLQDISEADATSEGVHSVQCNDLGTQVPYYRSLYEPSGLYRMLWESINGPGSWDANPWVWVVAFRRDLSSIDRRCTPAAAPSA